MAAGAGEAVHRLGDRVRRLAQAASAAAERAFKGDGVKLRAMALTYLSIFAIVPALVVAFSIIQALTGMDKIAGQVHEFLLENLAVGAQASIEPYLEKFTTNAHATSAGLVGFALLIWSAISLISSVDRAVNDLWGIRRRRRLQQQAMTYWVGLTVGPLLLAGSLGLGHAARAWLTGTGLGFLAAVGGVLLTCVFFTSIYQLVPDTRVKPWAAAVAGLVAGVAWEVAKGGYAFAVTRLFRYQVVYGSVAAVPIFLLWIYVSWTLVLFGARLAYLLQYAPALWGGGALSDHPATREALAGRALLQVARAFDAGAVAPDAGLLVRSQGVSLEDLTEVMGPLHRAGLVRSLPDGGWVPGRPLEKISLLDVRAALLGAPPHHPLALKGSVDDVLDHVGEEAARRLAETSFRSLCDVERAAPGTALADASAEARDARSGSPDDLET